MKVRPLALLLAALVALAGLVVPTAAPVEAQTRRVVLQLPFSCGETWRGNDGASKYHKGLEIDFNKGWGSQDLGKKVLAAAAGTVQFAGKKPNSGYGYYVQIKHPDKTYTLYAHMGRDLRVRKGQKVAQGQQIGTVSGSSRGSKLIDVHLHFEHKTSPFQRGFIRAVFDGKPYPYGRDRVYLKSNNCGQKKASPVRPVRPATGPVAHTALASLDGRTVRKNSNDAYPDLYAKNDPVSVVCRTTGQTGYADPTWALTTDHVWVAGQYLSHRGGRGVSASVRKCAVPTNAKSTVLLNTRSAKDMDAVAETDRYAKGDTVRVVCTALGGPTSQTGQHTWARTAERKWVPARYLDLPLTKAGLGKGLPRCDKDPARAAKPAPVKTAPPVKPAPVKTAPPVKPAPVKTAPPVKPAPVAPVKPAPAAGPVEHVALAGLDGRTVRDPGNHAYRDLYAKDDPVAVVCRSAGGLASGYPDPTWALTTDHVWVAAHYLSHQGKRGVSPTVRDCAVPTAAKSTVLLNTRSAKDMDAVAETDRYSAGDPVRVVCTALGGPTSQTGQHTWARTSEGKWVPARYLDLPLTEAGLGAGLPRCDTDPARPEKPAPAGPGPERRDGATRQPSERLIEFLKREEGLRRDHYTDPTGNCTVGYGRKVSDSPCTAAEERRPLISHETAEKWLREDVRDRVAATQRMTKGIPLAQHEWDAMLSMVFNLGTRSLTVYDGKPTEFITTLKKGPAHYGEMPARIEMFDAADSPQVRCGLNMRRQREARMFTLGDYDSSKVKTCKD